jgi:hypothetical protein
MALLSVGRISHRYIGHHGVDRCRFVDRKVAFDEAPPAASPAAWVCSRFG